MVNENKDLRSHCPVNFGLEAFGDKWSLLILRDIVFRAKCTYGDFLKSEEGFSTNILAARLEKLIAEGILEKRPQETDARKDDYVLTQKGLDLIPVLFEIMVWSSKYDPESEARRIPGLIEAITKDNRQVSREAIEMVKARKPLLGAYLRF